MSAPQNLYPEGKAVTELWPLPWIAEKTGQDCATVKAANGLVVVFSLHLRLAQYLVGKINTGSLAMNADAPSKEAVDCGQIVAVNLNILFSHTLSEDTFRRVKGTAALEIDRHFAPLRARIAELTSELEERDIRYAARELHTQGVVDENTTLRTAANQAAKALDGMLETPFQGITAQTHTFQKARNAMSALRAAGVTGEERCNSCDPSFTCWNGSVKCRKESIQQP